MCVTSRSPRFVHDGSLSLLSRPLQHNSAGPARTVSWQAEPLIPTLSLSLADVRPHPNILIIPLQ